MDSVVPENDGEPTSSEPQAALKTAAGGDSERGVPVLAVACAPTIVTAHDAVTIPAPDRAKHPADPGSVEFRSEPPTTPSEPEPPIGTMEAPPAPKGPAVPSEGECGSAELDLAELVASRVLGDDAFVRTVVDRLAKQMGDRVGHELAGRVAREVIDTAGDQLAKAVAELIADAWERSARNSSVAAGNGWTLRPRQRGGTPPRGRNPRA